jgi:hypothetical protein
LTWWRRTGYDGSLIEQGTVMKILKWAIVGCLVLIGVNLIANPQGWAIGVEAAWGLSPVLLVLCVLYAIAAGVRKLAKR